MSLDPQLRAHLEALVARGQRGVALGLDRVRAALASLGDPHLAQPAVIVAGTNGKGSTCAMLEAIAVAAGLRVGLTTSPHLTRFSERIRVGAAPIEDGAFAAALGRVLGDARGDLTFFETLTCAAFVAFAEASVDLAILEVGLGGRHDATNVVPAPLVSAIASITIGDGRGRFLEHAAWLGDSVAAIAREKAGILREGVPVAIGPLSPEARAAILAEARAVRSGEVWEVREPGDPALAAADVAVRPVLLEAGRGGSVRVELPGGASIDATPSLIGAHQRRNAALAAATAWLAGSAFGALRPAIAAGLAAARWPGRLERLEVERAPGVAIWLDAAHNLDGARALAEAFRQLGAPPSRTTLVFGALADKAFEPLLAELAPLADRRVFTAPRGRAPAPLEALVGIAPGLAVPSPVDAVERALASSGAGDAVLVCGSIYLVGEVRAHLLGLAADPPMGM